MSTVFLHVGQCGNQLGQVFWEEAISSRWTGHGGGGSSGGKTTSASGRNQSSQNSPSLPKSSSHSSAVTTRAKTPLELGYVPYTLIDGTIPCVLIDTEPKVIRHTRDKKHGSLALTQRVREDFCVSDKTGRGNNWAYGYYGRKGERESGSGEDLLGRVREAVRKMVEKCDRFSGFLLLHSIAGGTGSGLGSALLETLRTDYPLLFIITATVTPFSHGESPLQHYNSLLSLSWLQSYADAVLLFGNDSLLQQIQRSGAGRERGGAGVQLGVGDSGGLSVDDMNRHISGVLCNALMPLWKEKQRMPNVSYQEPWELIRSVCPDPKSKLITTNHVSFATNSNTWDQVKTLILRHAADSLWRRSEDTATKARTSSLALIARGPPSSISQFTKGLQPLESKLKKAYNTVAWNPFPVDYWLSYEPHFGQTKMATVLANCSVVLNYVEDVWTRSRVMFEERAYLHWYERYGCERETFEMAFESVQGIVDNYNTL